MLLKLQKAWYSNNKWVWCLAPLSFMFWLLSACRRVLYIIGILPTKSADIPVIVVGNIGIGGNGKTPLVLALVEYLSAQGYAPAVLSRGYGGQQSQFPYQVKNADSAMLVGDEPALIAKRKNTTVVIDPVRARGVQFITCNTKANVVICDDGLQHYAMDRDIELCVLDKRGIGNGYLLPMGPLREGVWRLDSVNAVINNFGFSDVNETKTLNANNKPSNYAMTLQAISWVNIKSNESVSLLDFEVLLEQAKQDGAQIDALAGIGDPKRFFGTLDEMKISTKRQIAFADHHPFVENDIPARSIVLMTEKDAVKCVTFAHENCWYLKINAHLTKPFFTYIEKGIETKAKLLMQSRT